MGLSPRTAARLDSAPIGERRPDVRRRRRPKEGAALKTVMLAAALAAGLASPGAAQEAGDSSEEEPNYLDLREDLGFPVRLRTFRKNYLLLGSWDDTLSDRPSPVNGEKNRDVEVKFQVSVKYAVFPPSWDHKDSLVFAYTSRSYWQVYQGSASSPFRTTDHEPELFWERRLSERRRLRVGVSHQSNGESGPEDRSWNRLYAEHTWSNCSYECTQPGSWRATVKGWASFGESQRNDDIEAYMGHFQVSGDYFFPGERRGHLNVSLRNNLRFGHQNRGWFELNYSFDVGEHVRILAQYTNGYGESLLDFRENVNRVGLGFELSP